MKVHNYCHVGPKSRPPLVKFLQQMRIILHPNMHLKVLSFHLTLISLSSCV